VSGESCPIRNIPNAPKIGGVGRVVSAAPSRRACKSAGGLIKPPSGLVNIPGGLINPPGGLVNPPGRIVNPPGGPVNPPGGLLKLERVFVLKIHFSENILFWQYTPKVPIPEVGLLDRFENLRVH
jgi:hypothetical protein